MAKVVRVEGKKGVSWRIDYLDPHGKRVRQMFKKRKDADAELGKRVSLMAEKRYLDVKKDYITTLKELVKKYKENFKDQASYETFKTYAIENIKAHFGEETRLSNIRYVGLETYRNQLRRKIGRNGRLYTDATVNKEIACFRHMLNKAVEWEMMEKNPFNAGKSLQLKLNNQRIRYLTETEIQKLRQNCPEYLKNIVDCAINTGMRRGEILSLKWSQIRDGFIYLRKTKTNEARQIPVNDTMEALLEHIKKHGEKSNVLNINKTKVTKIKKNTEYVFTFNGERVRSIQKGFTKALNDAGITDFRFHDLRHTFASHLVMNGATLRDVQELLGHKDPKMTLRYAHLSPEHKQKAVSLLNRLTAPKTDMSDLCQISETPKIRQSVTA